MLWLIALFIILQPGIFSKKKTFVKVEDVLLRALIFGIVMYFLGGSKEAFQNSNTTCNSPDGYLVRMTEATGPGPSIECLKQNVDISVKPTTERVGPVTSVLQYNDSQRVTIQDETGYYTARLMTKAQWNPDAGPFEKIFPFPTHNAVLMSVSNKRFFMFWMLSNVPEDKWDAVTSFWNSFIYEIPPTGASFTLTPSSAAAAPPLPIEPIPAEALSEIRAEARSWRAAKGPSPEYTGPPPPEPGDIPQLISPQPEPRDIPQLISPGPIASGPTGSTGTIGPPPPPGYRQALFLGQNDINALFDAIDVELSKISNGIKKVI